MTVLEEPQTTAARPERHSRRGKENHLQMSVPTRNQPVSHPSGKTGTGSPNGNGRVNWREASDGKRHPNGSTVAAAVNPTSQHRRGVSLDETRVLSGLVVGGPNGVGSQSSASALSSSADAAQSIPQDPFTQQHRRHHSHTSVPGPASLSHPPQQQSRFQYNTGGLSSSVSLPTPASSSSSSSSSFSGYPSSGSASAAHHPFAHPIFPGGSKQGKSSYQQQHHHQQLQTGASAVPSPPEVKFVNSTVEALEDQIRKEEAPKKKRTRTTPEQLRILQKVFNDDPMPSSDTRVALAKKLGMNARAVQVWFQNRRAKAKLEAKRAERQQQLSGSYLSSASYHHSHHGNSNSSSMVPSPTALADGEDEIVEYDADYDGDYLDGEGTESGGEEGPAVGPYSALSYRATSRSLRAAGLVGRIAFPPSDLDYLGPALYGNGHGQGLLTRSQSLPYLGGTSQSDFLTHQPHQQTPSYYQPGSIQVPTPFAGDPHAPTWIVDQQGGMPPGDSLIGLGPDDGDMQTDSAAFAPYEFSAGSSFHPGYHPPQSHGIANVLPYHEQQQQHHHHQQQPMPAVSHTGNGGTPQQALLPTPSQLHLGPIVRSYAGLSGPSLPNAASLLQSRTESFDAPSELAVGLGTDDGLVDLLPPIDDPVWPSLVDGEASANMVSPEGQRPNLGRYSLRRSFSLPNVFQSVTESYFHYPLPQQAAPLSTHEGFDLDHSPMTDEDQPQSDAPDDLDDLDMAMFDGKEVGMDGKHPRSRSHSISHHPNYPANMNDFLTVAAGVPLDD